MASPVRFHAGLDGDALGSNRGGDIYMYVFSSSRSLSLKLSLRRSCVTHVVGMLTWVPHFRQIILFPFMYFRTQGVVMV